MASSGTRCLGTEWLSVDLYAGDVIGFKADTMCNLGSEVAVMDMRERR